MTRFIPVPPPTANEQELRVIQGPKSRKVASTTLAGPTIQAASGLGSMGGAGKNQISSKPKNNGLPNWASRSALVGTAKEVPSVVATGRSGRSSGLVSRREAGSLLLSMHVMSE